MYGNSRVPASAQNGIHPHLSMLLDRHAGTPFRKPYADYNRVAFTASLQRFRRTAPGTPLILDSCCGVGESSLILARSFSGPLRDRRGPVGSAVGARPACWQEGFGWPANLDLVRADVVDYWRLLHAAGIRLDRHYLLYPNPWPKIAHLSRRWHGHPVFPALLGLGGMLECRSNWPVYLAEFCFAVQQMTQRPALIDQYFPDPPMTPFERKYLASGHRLFRTIIDLA
jgi:tRNA (guanine-N7-)-methyltransferase